MRPEKIWGMAKIGYRLKCLTECDIFFARSSKSNKFMRNLLKKLVSSRKKMVRPSRSFGRRFVSFQIAKMGRMGQQLVVASR